MNKTIFLTNLVQKQILEGKFNFHSHTHKILDFLWVFFWYSQIFAFFVVIDPYIHKFPPFFVNIDEYNHKKLDFLW